MYVTNSKLERLETTRDRVRKDINKLMRSKGYYTDNALYEKVKALTSLECYLSYCIETIRTKVFLADIDEDYM